MNDLVIPPLVQRVADACHHAGGRCLLVGGSVRDHLTGKAVKDWDLEVYGLEPEALERTLRKVGRIDTVGRAFSVFKLHVGRLELDISLPRRDSKVGPGHTGIEATGDPSMDPAEAARRRDLTINAMMVDLHDGSLLDPWGGLEDLRARRLSPVDADTFLEDPLRTLRVVQFAARLDFEATDALVALCRSATLDELPAERVLGEWAKLLLRGVRPSRGLAFAHKADLLGRVFPEHPHAPSTGAHLDAATVLRDETRPEGRRLALMTAVWLYGVGGTEAEATLDRLRLFRWHGVDARTLALAAAAHADDPVATDRDLRWLSTRAQVSLVLAVKRSVTGLDVEDRLVRASALGVLQEAPGRFVEGRDVLALGIPPSRRVGDLVTAVYEAQLNGDVSTPQEARAHLASLVS